MTVKPAYDLMLNQVAITHYRVPFLAALAQHPRVHLTVAAGADDWGPAMTLRTEVPGAHVLLLKNRWSAGRRFVWQSGLWSAVSASDVVVLPFNPRILSGLAAFVQCRLRRRPVILWGHGLGKSGLTLAARFRGWMGRQADALIMYSDRGRQDMYALGIPAEKVFVARNSIDVGSIVSAASPADVEQNRILCVGRLIPGKKVPLLLQAFALSVPSLPPDVRLTIIGDGPERTSLENIAMGLGIGERVDFTGTIVDERALAPYFYSSLFAVCSGYVGLSAVHSLAYGRPVVVADNEPHCPEIESLSPGHNSEFFRADSAEDLSRVIVSLTKDRPRLDSLANNALDTVKKRGYGVSQMVEGFLDAIDFAWASRGSIRY